MTFRSGCAAILFLASLLWAEFPGAESDSSGVFEKKSVLVLEGGAFSPWYSLGALYAIRDYRIPIDSVVGVSWGAFVGALWSSGFELDEIQRILTDSLAVSLILEKESAPEFSLDLPISFEGAPSLAFRFTLFGDSLGYAHVRKKSLEPDFRGWKTALLKFRFEEALSRADSTLVPFSALACERGSLRVSTVRESWPFSKTSGDKCPGFVPEDSAFNIVVIAHPVRESVSRDADFAVAGLESAAAHIRKRKDQFPEQNLVLVRPHALSEVSPLALMRTGYADMEKKLGELSVLAAREKESPLAKDSLVPRFKWEPSFERIPSAYFSHASSFWNAADTGALAPENFLSRIALSPFYDSVQVNVDTAGIANVSAVASPLMEFRLGGFGSNLTGPLAYAGMDFRYVDQFEYAFSVDGFAGEHSYAIRPKLEVRGMFGNRGGFCVAGNISKWELLKGYFSELPENLKMRFVRTNDLNVSFDFRDSLADFRIQVLMEESEFGTYRTEDGENLRVNTLIPEILIVRRRGGFEDWFGEKGYSLNGKAGFRSVNLTQDGTGSAPLYFSSTVDVQTAFSPARFLSLGIGAVGGVNIRRESGHGYEYPEALKAAPGEVDWAVDNWYRLHPALSPWSVEWNFAESSSHHYGAFRANAGLHGTYFGFWIFCAYMRDFEENPSIGLDANRLLLEPLVRFAYRSIDVRLGMNRFVSASDFSKFRHIDDYRYFFQVGANW